MSENSFQFGGSVTASENPRRRFALGRRFVAFGVLAIWLTYLGFALLWLEKVPFWGVTFITDETGAALVTETVLPEGPADVAGLAPGDVIVGLVSPNERETFRPTPQTLKTSRGQTTGYAEWRAVMEQKEALWAFRQGPVEFLLADGRSATLDVTEPSGIYDFPLLFWSNGILSLIMLGVSFGLIQFARPSIGVWLVALGSLFHSLHLLTHAIRSTMVLTLPPSLWETVYFVVHGIGWLHTVVLLGVLWHLPRAPNTFPLFTISFVIGILVFAVQNFEIFEFPFHGFLLPYMFVLGAGLIVIAYQWFTWRSHPVERAVLLWVHMSIMAFGIPWIMLIVVPGLIGLQPIISTNAGSYLITLIYIGFVFASIRYRLFAIDAVWFGVVTWLLMVLVFFLVDILLIFLLDFEAASAASFAAVVAFWSFFPAKALFLDYLLRRNWIQWDQAAINLTDEINDLTAPDEIDGRFIGYLKRLFHSSRAEISEASEIRSSELGSNGLTLSFPMISRPGTVTLFGRDEGSRLFNARDRRIVDLLCGLAERLHFHSVEAGHRRAHDRSLIARDLHDHLGAKLLNIVYLLPDGSPAKQEAHAAMRAMRDSVLTLEEGQELNLHAAWAAIREEQFERLRTNGMLLNSNEALVGERIIDGRSYVNIKRIVEELMRNS